jgi:predicted mannosyl-3-phosphoglycerate phosphatase (HAD superfamily)
LGYDGYAMNISGRDMKKIVIFTDLDGTLLDAANYSHAAALPALEMIATIASAR